MEHAPSFCGACLKIKHNGEIPVRISLDAALDEEIDEALLRIVCRRLGISAESLVLGDA